MRLRLFTAFLLVCCATSFGQTPDESGDDAHVSQSAPQTKPLAPPPATASITGTVYCNDTHRPARGAVVVAQPIPKRGHMTADFNTGMTRVALDGTYTLQHLRPGDYTVVALLPGYISPYDDLPLAQTGDLDSEIRDRFTHNGVVSIHNDAIAHFDVTLERGATITGRVLYDDGAPATQVIINLEDVNAKPSTTKPAEHGDDDERMPNVEAGALFRSFFLHQSQGTDDQGNFRISGIKPGTYRIAALPVTIGQSSGVDEAETFIFGGVTDARAVHFYSGDTLHKNAAKTYELRAGDDATGVDITIPVYLFHRIEGHLTTLDGHPIFTAALTLTDTSDDAFVLHARAARDGGFVFPEVPSGTYKLAVADAKIGTLPDFYPDTAPIPTSMLKNVQSFADTTTTVLVKDSDITDIAIQMQSAQSAPAQPAAASTMPSGPN